MRPLTNPTTVAASWVTLRLDEHDDTVCCMRRFEGGVQRRSRAGGGGGEDGGGYHARSLQKRMRDKQPMFVRTPSHMLIEHSIMFVRVL